MLCQSAYGRLEKESEKHKKENREFESFENALSFACMNLSMSRTELIRNSKIYKNMKEQMRITDFFSNNG